MYNKEYILNHNNISNCKEIYLKSILNIYKRNIHDVTMPTPYLYLQLYCRPSCPRESALSVDIVQHSFQFFGFKKSQIWSSFTSQNVELDIKLVNDISCTKGIYNLVLPLEHMQPCLFSHRKIKGAFTHTRGEAMTRGRSECKRVQQSRNRVRWGEARWGEAVPRGIASHVVQYLHSGSIHT